jgi:predicted short-subunit dehydrogenase-like oxidoreductase (DUF2520 family)
MTEPDRSTTRPGRLDVGVVGAGRVGAALGSALRSVGHVVVGASGISSESLERIDTLLPGVPALEVLEVVARADLVLLTVPDDVLASLVAGLAEVGAWRAGQIVVHTSGRYGTDVLAPARAAGVIPLAIHPAMTFTGTSLDLSRMVGCSFAVTGPAPVLPIGQALVVEVGGEPVLVAESDRPLYHAALAHGANHLVVLVAQAAEALAAAGIDDPGRVLTPLLTAALDGALRSGEQAIRTMTGPVVRGDTGTVQDHLRTLTQFGVQAGSLDVVETYRVLARSAARRALAAGMLRPDTAGSILDVLATPAPPGATDADEDDRS